MPYSSWRPNQREAIEQALNSPKKVVFISAPTGSGKSGVAMSIARLSGSRSVIVTSTKQLQRQYLSEFRALDPMHLIGKDNYKCIIDRKFTVSEAPCQAGWSCSKMWTCDYFSHKRRAASFATPVVTNYPYFLGETQNSADLHKLDVLILDEGHLAENALMQHVNVSLEEKDLRRVGLHLPQFGTLEKYREWGAQASEDLRYDLQKTAEYITQYSRDPFADEILVRRYQLLRGQLQIINSLEKVEKDWILERKPKKVMFRPVWVKKYGRLYTAGAKKLIIQSATIASPDKIAELLNIEDFEYIELPSQFPRSKRPLHYWPIAKVGMNMETGDLDLVIEAIDKIIEKHPNERGIIHTVNYSLRDALLLKSKYAAKMLTHSGQDRDIVIDSFLEDEGPDDQILVSPSVTSGVNASYHRCGYQVIMKIPFADTNDEQTRLRMAEDSEWYSYNAASTLVQAYGRAMRYEDDFGETYILDKHFSWFYSQNMHMFPVFFKEAVRKISAP